MTGEQRLTAGQFGVAYAAVLVVILVLDGIWLGLVAKDLYQREMGDLMAQTFRVVPMVIFYTLYPVALVYLALHTAPSGLAEAILRGAVLGLAAYGAYDMTNLAIIRGWPVKITLIDLAWGTFLSAAAAAAGYAATWARH